MGEKLLTQSMRRAYGARDASIRRHLLKVGDLGLVAERLAPRGRPSGLSVREAHEALLAIARASGPGSVDRKVERLAKLLSRVGGAEARLLIGIAQGKLRLGIGDQTLLDAAALGAFGDRRKKRVMERAYNVRSDLAEVVTVAFEKGERSLARVRPRPGIHVHPALAQRLPSAAAIIRWLGTVQVEPKYDGFRLQLHRDGRDVWAFSRRMENVTAMFPDLAAAFRRQLRVKRAIVEGEAIAHNPDRGEFQPFQITMTRKRKTRVADLERCPLRLFAFDLLLAGHRSLLSEPQRSRARRLRKILRFQADSRIVVTESVTARRTIELQRFFDAMIANGLEGVIAKQPDAAYQAGARGFDWIKLKRVSQSTLRDTVDLVLVGYVRGRGKRAALGVGSLLGAVYDAEHDRFRTVAKIGSGLTDAACKAMRSRLDADAVPRKPPLVDSLIRADVWVEPRYVVEVLAEEITRSPMHTCGRRGDSPGYGLRFPRLLGGVRADRSATDATTQREIIQMYKQQRRR